MSESFKLEDLEKVHNNNISKLIELYGTKRELEIRELYQENKTKLESNSTIKDHLPFFTYQQTEKILIERYGKPIKLQKTEKPDNSESDNKGKTLETPRKRKGLLRFLFD